MSDFLSAFRKLWDNEKDDKVWNEETEKGTDFATPVLASMLARVEEEEEIEEMLESMGEGEEDSD